MTKTEAIILRTVDLGEVDRFLTIYTKEFGKIQVVARGVKKIESKLRYNLEPFSHSHFILIQGKNFRIVKDAILRDQFLPMRKDLERIKIVYKIVDLVDELIVGEEKDEDIWNLLLKAFKELNMGGLPAGRQAPVTRIVRGFQDNLLRLLGYDPAHIKDLSDIY